MMKDTSAIRHARMVAESLGLFTGNLVWEDWELLELVESFLEPNPNKGLFSR
jgi:hypothetical protein